MVTVASVGLDREHRARLHTLPVEVHGAGTAVGRVASDQRADLAESLAQILHQQCSRLDVIGIGDAVDELLKFAYNTRLLVDVAPEREDAWLAGDGAGLG